MENVHASSEIRNRDPSNQEAAHLSHWLESAPAYDYICLKTEVITPCNTTLDSDSQK
jgi:hypothetical protein